MAPWLHAQSKEICLYSLPTICLFKYRYPKCRSFLAELPCCHLSAVWLWPGYLMRCANMWPTWRTSMLIHTLLFFANLCYLEATTITKTTSDFIHGSPFAGSTWVSGSTCLSALAAIWMMSPSTAWTNAAMLGICCHFHIPKAPNIKNKERL